MSATDSTFNGYYHDLEMNPRVYAWIKALEEESYDRITVLELAYLNLNCDFDGCFHKTKTINSNFCHTHKAMWELIEAHRKGK